MSLATSNRDGGRTNEAGHLRGFTKGFIGQVLNGLSVSQRGAGANMSVDVAIGDAIIKRSDNTYSHPAWNDAVYNQVVAAADGSNPRRDIIVMYIDYNQTPSTGVANNTNGVVKIASIAGTAAGSPVDPSNATIQSAVGSGNPWIKLARIRVAAGATSVSSSVIDDLRLMATGEAQGGWIYDSTYNWVYASPTTFTIAGVNVRDQFPVGSKLRIMQGGAVKYFEVTQTAFTTNTTVTVTGKGTYTLANSPIDAPAVSYVLTPRGYPFPPVGSVMLDLATLPTKKVQSKFSLLNGNTNSTLYVPIPNNDITATLNKKFSTSKIIISLSASFFITGAMGEVIFGVKIGSNIYDVTKMFKNELGSGEPMSGEIEIPGITTIGNITAQFVIKTGSTSVFINFGNSNAASLKIEEVPAD